MVDAGAVIVRAAARDAFASVTSRVICAVLVVETSDASQLIGAPLVGTAVGVSVARVEADTGGIETPPAFAAIVIVLALAA